MITLNMKGNAVEISGYVLLWGFFFILIFGL